MRRRHTSGSLDKKYSLVLEFLKEKIEPPEAKSESCLLEIEDIAGRAARFGES